MNKHPFLILLALCLCLSQTISAQQKHSRVEQSLDIFNDVMRQLDLNYVDTLPYETLTETAINAMLRHIDPYTIYYPKKNESDLKLMTTGKYGGIGSIIMQRTETNKKGKKEQYVCISDPYQGMPAEEADIRAGDIILSIDGKSVIGKTTKEVSDMLRGAPGTTLKIELRRQGIEKPIVKEIQRKEIKMPAVDFYKVINLPQGKTGYISFTEFTEKSSNEFRTALQDMVETDKIDTLIIDLRGNGGGIIDEAVSIMSLFVPKGTDIVSTKGKDPSKNRVYKTATTPLYPDMTLYVLVNNQSASASEILCGSMQDLDRATLIGTRTYGKGLVQNIRNIAYDGHLKVTTAKYYIPSGRCIQAIDYSKRRADGSVERVPDSLIHKFHTKKGRIVTDGGGIVPDINTEDTTEKLDITYSLYMKNLFFDFATEYRLSHPTLPSPADFIVEDSLIADFEKFLEKKNYVYETESSKYLNDLIRLAKQEDLDSTTIRQIEDLAPMLRPSVHEALMRSKKHLQMYIGSDIVARYYFQKGRIEYNLRFDKDLQAIR